MINITEFSLFPSAVNIPHILFQRKTKLGYRIKWTFYSAYFTVADCDIEFLKLNMLSKKTFGFPIIDIKVVVFCNPTKFLPNYSLANNYSHLTRTLQAQRAHYIFLMWPPTTFHFRALFLFAILKILSKLKGQGKL